MGGLECTTGAHPLRLWFPAFFRGMTRLTDSGRYSCPLPSISWKMFASDALAFRTVLSFMDATLHACRTP